MNNIPENENINDLVAENTEQNSQDDFSTVFSNPTEHKTSAQSVKRKKLLPTIIACFLIVAVLIGGTFAVIKFIPEKEDGENTSSAIDDIEVLSLDSNDFKTVTVTNNNGTFKLYSVEDKVDSTSSNSSETTKTVTWYLEGYKENILSTSSIANIANSIATVSASREVTARTAADCGLEKPDIKAVVVDSKNEEFTVLLGDESPDKSGYYFKLEDSDKIYVVDSTIKDTLDFTAVSLADTSILPAFPLESVDSKYKTEDGALYSFDKLTFTGKNFSEPLKIVQITKQDVVGFATYKIISPTNRVAENLDSVLEIFKNGVAVSGAYALDTSAKTLSSLGLDSPDLTVKMEIEKQSLTFKFKLQADGGYAAVCDGSAIVKKVEADAIPFINNKTSDFYSDWVCLNFIDDLKGFTFKVGDTSYDFSIQANPDEESDEQYIIKHNGKSITSSDFQDFYQDCISLKCSDFTANELSGKADYVMTYTYKDDIGGKQTVEFTRYSETKYQYTVDGEALGKVTAASLKALETSLKELLENN